MQGCVCDKRATQTTAIDIAKQNSEGTVSLGGVQKGGGGAMVDRGTGVVNVLAFSAGFTI